MKVSFIVPVYNAEHYLPRLIQSLEAQTQPDWEALFTDDGSSDRSVEILRTAAMRDCRFKLFYINHGGSSGARNKGLDNATGDLIGFIDADDFVHPQLVADAMAYMSDMTLDCFMFDYVRVDPGGDSPFIPYNDNSHSEVIEDMIKWAQKPWRPMAHALWRFVYRRSVIGNLRFYQHIKHQDMLFSYQVWGGVKKTLKVDRAYYAYVEAPGSIIRSTYTSDKVESNFIIFRELCQYYLSRQDILKLIEEVLFSRRIRDVLKQVRKVEPHGGPLTDYFSVRLFGLIRMIGFRYLHFSIRTWLQVVSLCMHGQAISVSATTGWQRRFESQLWRLRKLPSYKEGIMRKPWNGCETIVEKPITVIIPVYNGLDCLKRLTRTLFAHTDQKHKIVFCDDASTDKNVVPFLKGLEAEHGNVRVIRNPRNLGFAANCNNAIASTSGDFVLLNTDTEVPANWIPRLFLPLWIDPKTASVTPMSCESHLVGVPNPRMGTKELVERLGVSCIDSVISRITVNMTRNFLTEGVGFCMAISREAWNTVGTFDAKTFGRGYGEEFEWSLRAMFKFNYVNRFAQNVFVAHWHNGSFSVEETKELQKKNNPIAARIHPEYGTFRNRASKYSRRAEWKLACRLFKESGLLSE